MFTGIIEETGTVEACAQAGGAWRLRVSAARVLGGLASGDSIAVNGCCLTATEFDGRGISFDLLEETRRLTNFRDIAPGSRVNLERSLRADSRLSGHFVTGHIDGTGSIEVFEARGSDHYLKIRAPKDSARLLIRKGSIAVDGISLTVAEVEGDSFAVWIIPHTLAATNLPGRRKGAVVNLEFDMLGKYVDKLLQLQKI
jgi:riboflavin synthase